MSSLTVTNRQRLKLIALIALFVGPLVASWAMLEWRVGIPDERTAHGRLMPPLPTLDDWPLAQPKPAIDADDWVLAYECENECAQVADRWWRLHRALGREAPRVTRLRVGGGGEALPGEVSTEWLSKPEWSAEESLWILDPGGLVVLGYRGDHDASEVLDDIQRLLRMNPEY